VDGDVRINPLDSLSSGLQSEFTIPSTQSTIVTPQPKKSRATKATKRTAKSTKSKQCVCRVQDAPLASVVTLPWSIIGMM